MFVGITTPLTGPYSADGKDEQLGYELAIAEINAGSPTAQKWGLKGKGVLGKTVHYKIADSETKPNVAVQAQTGFIQNDKAIMITGCVSSATAIALEELAQREKVLNMVGLSGSNDTTGKNCQRYGFRSQPSAYMACKALAPVVAKALGQDLKAAYLVPDYSYGHSVFDSSPTPPSSTAGRWRTQQLVPLGTTDFSSALLNIANSGADVFVNMAFGADAVASTKQADQFGVLKKMKLVVPNISSFQAKETGAALMQGVYGTFDFWWTMEDRYPLAKDFVQAFLANEQISPALGRPHRLHADAALGGVGGAGEDVQPGRGDQDAGGVEVRSVRNLAGQGLVPRRGPPACPPGARRGRQGPVGHEEPGRLLRRGGGRARRAT